MYSHLRCGNVDLKRGRALASSAVRETIREPLTREYRSVDDHDDAAAAPNPPTHAYHCRSVGALPRAGPGPRAPGLPRAALITSAVICRAVPTPCVLVGQPCPAVSALVRSPDCWRIVPPRPRDMSTASPVA